MHGSYVVATLQYLVCNISFSSGCQPRFSCQYFQRNQDRS